MSALEYAINLISDDEAESIETSQHSDLISDDEDIVPPRRRLAPKSRSIQDNVFSDSESDDDPTRVASIRSRVRQVQPSVARITSNDELGLLRKHYSYLEDEDEHTAKGVYFRLENFKIEKTKTGQLESLHRVALHKNKLKPQYRFSGTLVHEGGSRQVVSDIDIWYVAIDNLGRIEDDIKPSSSTVAKSIYLATVDSSRYNCYYLLGSASEDYGEIYRNFQWLADFLKHITDYLIWSSMNEKSVNLQDFKINFIERIKGWHSGDEDFDSWHDQCGKQIDFQQHLCCPTNTEFIFHTIRTIVQDEDDLLEHTIWDDLSLPPTAREPETASQTLITSHMACSFLESFPQWGRHGHNLLKTIDLAPNVLMHQESRSRRVGLGNKSFYKQASHFEEHEGRKISKAALFLERASKFKTANTPTRSLIGHAIVARQHSYRCSRPCICDTYKLALVISATNLDVGVRWLTLPLATICAGRSPEKRAREEQHPFYPIGNEVFLSDECCCDKVLKSDIFAVASITINEDHTEVGDKFFVHRKWVSSENKICCFDDDEIGLCPEHEDYVPQPPKRRRGGEEVASVVSLFSGLGLLDHGLFEGSNGVLASSLVVELDRDAIRSYRANHKGDKPCEFVNEDVNKPFQRFCTGEKDFPTCNMLVAGNPCRGFSRRNGNKTSVKSQRHCTLLAHTLSWVDVFRPEMVLIENVPGMDEGKPSALGQAVCCLVSMAYQVKVMTIKASDYGAATDRTRLILMATAPGISLPVLPSPTHGSDRGQHCLVTASAVTSDLHPITNHTFINPRVPYHVPVQHLPPLVDRIVTKIPRTSRKTDRMPNISDAVLSNPDEREYFRNLTDEQKKKSAGTLRRVHPNQPFRTITTHISFTDARGPATLHWFEDRLVSFLEVRRFQGTPNEFLQIGQVYKQLQQTGNSVEYNFAKLLGKVWVVSWKGVSMYGDDGQRRGEMDNHRVVHELSDDDDETSQAFLISSSSPSSRVKATRISVDVPSIETVRRRLRNSMSLQPSTETTDDDSDFPALDTSYSRRMRRIVLDDDDDDRDQSEETTEPESVMSWGSRSATAQSLSSDEDDLPEVRILLTPSRQSTKRLSTEPRKRSSQYSTPSHPRQAPRVTFRRRRRSPSDEESDEYESPTKKAKLKSMTPLSNQQRSLASQYGLDTPDLLSSFTSMSEGDTAESPIVLD